MGRTKEGGRVDVLNVGPRLLVGFFITRRCILLVCGVLAATWRVPHCRYRSVGVGKKEEEEGEEGWGGRPGWD